jgi:hypothetical protein
VRDLLVDLVGLGREAPGEARAVVELDEEELVARIGGAEERGGGLLGFLHLVAHAAAGIEEEADRDRGVIGRETGDRLLDAIFEDVEGIGTEAVDGRAQAVGDVHRHQHEGRVDAQQGRLAHRVGTRALPQQEIDLLVVRRLKRRETGSQDRDQRHRPHPVAHGGIVSQSR